MMDAHCDFFEASHLLDARARLAQTIASQSSCVPGYQSTAVQPHEIAFGYLRYEQARHASAFQTRVRRVIKLFIPSVKI